MAKEQKLFRDMELAFRTQYAEVKERTLAAGKLLTGTPGSLALRSGSGYSYWYRDHYAAPGKRVDEAVCKDGDEEKLQAMRDRMAFATWVSEQVPALRKLGFQVADKSIARVLVELHNQGAFDAGLVLVGTLAYMAWLNELGAMAVSARTLDIDLARRQKLKLAAPLPFLATMKATGLPFTAVPGMPSSKPATSVKLPGVQGLRVDVLAPGKTLGALVRVQELDWMAQSVPYYDYLLEAPEPAAMLAGWQCVPVRLPQAARMVWHKLYSSQKRQRFPEKAAKDLQQALVLAAVLIETEPVAIERAFKHAPTTMIKDIQPVLPIIAPKLGAQNALLDVFNTCLSRPAKQSI